MALLPDHYAGVRCMGDRAPGMLFLFACFDPGYSSSGQKYKRYINIPNVILAHLDAVYLKLERVGEYKP